MLVQESRSLEAQGFTGCSSCLVSVSVRVPGDHGQRVEKEPDGEQGGNLG